MERLQRSIQRRISRASRFLNDDQQVEVIPFSAAPDSSEYKDRQGIEDRDYCRGYFPRVIKSCFRHSSSSIGPASQIRQAPARIPAKTRARRFIPSSIMGSSALEKFNRIVLAPQPSVKKA